MSALITIIVPVYNSEKYLSECLDSLVAQTYPHLEIILVNDGSKDQSAEICDKYAKRYSQIRAFHNENQGVSKTRNFGLEQAAGQYIAFCDSDDIVHPELYERLLQAMQFNDAEMCCCKMLKFMDGEFDSDIVKEPLVGKTKILENDNRYEPILMEKECAGYVWNKLFSRALIERESATRFQADITILEDLLFVLNLIAKVKCIVYLDEKLYYYRQCCGSVMHQKFNAKALTAMIARERIQQLLDEQQCAQHLCSSAWNELMKCYCITAKKVIFSKGIPKIRWLKYIIRNFKQAHGKYLLNDSWSAKEKYYYAMVRGICMFVR